MLKRKIYDDVYLKIMIVKNGDKDNVKACIPGMQAFFL